jgi:sphingolipid 8-(E)-desaturase
MTVGFLHLQIVLSHFAMDTDPISASIADECDFITRTARSTMNISCPLWLDWLHGGLHLQIEHHLIPRMPRANLRKAQPFVRELFKELRLPYHEASLFEAVMIVLRHMYSVSLLVKKE